MKYLILYLIIVNAASFFLMLTDKIRARKNKWRIRESTLILSAAVGGSVGALLGMYTLRHKTKHLKFTLGIPVILVLQIVAAIFLYSRFFQ